MTEQEILEGNELIGIFMGGMWKDVNIGGKPCKRFYLPSKSGWDYIKLEYLGYHNGWDELMPVWFNIRDLRFKEVKHECEHADIKQNCAHTICYRDIQSAYHEIVNAIKWYNTITK